MNDTDTRALVAELLAQIAPEAALAGVGDSEDLREALDLDSMDFMNFVAGLHRATGRAIPPADVPMLYTLGGIVRYLA